MSASSNNNKKKVAIILHGLGANGIDSLFANLSEVWSDNFEIYYFIAVDDNVPQFWDNKISQTRVKVVKLHDLDKGRLKRWPKTLYDALKLYGPFDAIHSNMDLLNGISMTVGKLVGIPVRLSHAHRGNSTYSTSVIRNLIAKGYRGVMRLLANNLSTHLIACSDVAGRYFFGKKKYILLYNGINLNAYRKQSGESQSLNKLDNPRFITVGRMTSQKNPLKIISVFNAVHSLLPSSTLTWCGDGELRNEVENEISKMGIEQSVNLVGRTDKVADYLQNSDYFLLPSLFEGLSLALAEAQAAGLDCFVSDTCSKLSDCGKCIFIPLNVSDKEWAEIIISHVRECKLAIDENKLDRFDINTLARKLESLYASND